MEKTENIKCGKIITFGNQKGGVGKTTLTLQTSLALSNSGHRVLLVDADGQGSLTHTFTHNKVDFNNVSLDAMTRTLTLLESTPERISPFQINDNLDIICTTPVSDEMFFVGLDVDTQANNFVTNLKLLSEGYDFVLIDTCPGMSAGVYGAYIASDHIVIPVIAAEYSIPALANTLASLRAIEENIGKPIQCSIVFNNFNQKKIAQKVHDKIRELADPRLFMQTRIPSRAAFVYTLESAQEISKVPGGRFATDDMQKFVVELLGRIVRG